MCQKHVFFIKPGLARERTGVFIMGGLPVSRTGVCECCTAVISKIGRKSIAFALVAAQTNPDERSA
jgi:hypothetical protein